MHWISQLVSSSISKNWRQLSGLHIP
jgi:hypothetical protein